MCFDYGFGATILSKLSRGKVDELAIWNSGNERDGEWFYTAEGYGKREGRRVC
jgi:hypothetical protein